MKTASLTVQLNDRQLQAVTSDDPHLLVLAGAGSGKTRVLTRRLAWLVKEQGVDSRALLAVTFTNKAASEMRERVEKLLEMPCRHLWIGTFHGLAHRLLRFHWRDAGLPQNFQILDSDGQQRLVKLLLGELGLDDKQFPPRQMQWLINQTKDAGLRPGAVPANPHPHHERWLALYQAYEERCRRLHVVDFAELLLRSCEVWKTCPALLEHYQQRFREVLVDEFQDTNAIQYRWLRLLAGGGARFCVVGDDDQSIYGWRGARYEHLQRFQKDFKGTRLIRLEQNYRSSGRILEVANELIAHNANRLGKKLWTDKAQGEPVTLYAAYNEKDEARQVVSYLEDWLGEGNSLGDAAVLYRSNAQSRVLEEALIQAGLPYRIYGGLRFYDRMEIRNALAYLRLLVSRDDNLALERVINLPPRGIGKQTLEKLRDHAQEQDCSLWEAMAGIGVASSGARLGGLKRFQELVNRLAEETRGRPLSEIVNHVLVASGLLEHHQKDVDDRAGTRVENLKELINAAAQYESVVEQDQQLQEFLAAVALDAGEEAGEESEDVVRLMTLHASKGLEFPLVCIIGLEEKLFPHAKALENLGGLEEERRLCYVGLTRAIARLHLSYAYSRYLHGGTISQKPSRFLEEAGLEEQMDSRARSVKVSRPVEMALAAASKAQSRKAAERRIAGKWALGQQVRHPKFGEGVIVNYEGQGEEVRVEVRFGYHRSQSKWLVLSLARLEAV